MRPFRDIASTVSTTQPLKKEGDVREVKVKGSALENRI
jgi:hypothetical protein